MDDSAFTEEATDTILTWICNERKLYSEMCSMIRGGADAWRNTFYPEWCERALLRHSQIMAIWMDDPECDLNDYLVNPAEVDWQAIWDHFEQLVAQAQT
jgi:hypothetical protein